MSICHKCAGEHIDGQWSEKTRAELLYEKLDDNNLFTKGLTGLLADHIDRIVFNNSNGQFVIDAKFIVSELHQSHSFSHAVQDLVRKYAINFYKEDISITALRDLVNDAAKLCVTELIRNVKEGNVDGIISHLAKQYAPYGAGPGALVEDWRSEPMQRERFR